MTTDSSNGAQHAKRPSLAIAILLSLLAPGAGHLYAGRLGKGLTLWLVGTAGVWAALLGGLASTFMGLVVLLAGVAAYGIAVAVSAGLDAARAHGAKSGKGRWFAVVILIVCQVMLGHLPLRLWAPVRAFKMPSGGMEPTLLVGDFMMADMAAWSRHAPQRGELVIHRMPNEPERLIVKRVIGLPGDRIEIRAKRVYIDGRPIEDPWAVHSDSHTYADSRFYPPQVLRRDQLEPLVVPEGSFFLLGDNRDESNDSRFSGPVDRSLLVGRPLYIYWSVDSRRIGQSLSSR